MSGNQDVTVDQILQEAADAPAVQTGDIEQASFTINRYAVEDGQVREEEADAGITQEELDEIEREIETAVETELSEMADEPQPESGGEQMATEIAETPSPGADEPESDAMQIGREIAERENIGKTDFVTFRTSMLDEDIDTDTISEVWSDLRDEGVIGEPPDDAGDDGEDDAEPVTEAPDDTDDEGVDAVYLVTTEGCPGCQMAKDHMEEHIEDGPVEVIDIQKSDKAADIAVELGITTAPQMVVEDDGNFYRLANA